MGAAGVPGLFFLLLQSLAREFVNDREVTNGGINRRLSVEQFSRQGWYSSVVSWHWPVQGKLSADIHDCVTLSGSPLMIV